MDQNLLQQLRATDRRVGHTEVIERGGGSGSSFPTGIAAGYQFFRTDIGFLCFYDGTRWLTSHEYMVLLDASEGQAVSFAGAATRARHGNVRSDYVIHFERVQMRIITGATNNGANYLSYTFVDQGGTAIISFNTSADAAATEVVKAFSSGWTQPAGGISDVRLNIAVTGAPSAQTPRSPIMFYRLIVP